MKKGELSPNCSQVYAALLVSTVHFVVALFAAWIILPSPFSDAADRLISWPPTQSYTWIPHERGNGPGPVWIFGPAPEYQRSDRCFTLRSPSLVDVIFMQRQRPNQVLQPTAGRSDTWLSDGFNIKLSSKLTLASGS